MGESVYSLYQFCAAGMQLLHNIHPQRKQGRIIAKMAWKCLSGRELTYLNSQSRDAAIVTTMKKIPAWNELVFEEARRDVQGLIQEGE